MFIAHYTKSLALKEYQSRAPLGWLFIAVQFVDILFFPLSVLGQESITFENKFTAVNNFVMNFPFTH